MVSNVQYAYNAGKSVIQILDVSVFMTAVHPRPPDWAAYLVSC